MKCMDKHEFEQQNVFGTGAANTAYAKFFIGQSFLNPLTDPKTGLFLANVTFEPGCRNNWHIHHDHFIIRECLCQNGAPGAGTVMLLVVKRNHHAVFHTQPPTFSLSFMIS